MSEQEIQELREASARTAYYSQDVADREASLRQAPQAPPPSAPVLTQRERDLLAKKEKLEEDIRERGEKAQAEKARQKQYQEELEQAIKDKEAGRQNDSFKGASLSRLRGMLRNTRKWEGYDSESFNDRNQRDFNKIEAIKQALAKGTRYQDERRLIEKHSPQYDTRDKPLTPTQERLRAEGRFKTRQRGQDATVGKTTGIYKSEVSGKPVVVRAERQNAKFYYNPYEQAKNFYTRDYVVNARVGGGKFTSNEIQSSKTATTPPPSSPAPALSTSESLPLGEFGSNVSVVPSSAVVTPILTPQPLSEQKQFLTVDEEPRKITSATFRSARKNIYFSDSDTVKETARKQTNLFTSTVSEGVFAVGELFAPLVEPYVDYSKRKAEALAELDPEAYLQANKDVLTDYQNVGADVLIVAGSTVLDPVGTGKGYVKALQEKPVATGAQTVALLYSPVKFAGAKVKARTATTRTKGRVATPDVVDSTAGVPAREFRVQAVNKVDFQVAEQAYGEASVRVTKTRPTLAEPELLAPEDIPVVDAYDVVVSGRQSNLYRDALKSDKAGVSESVAPRTVEDFSGTGRASPQEVAWLSERNVIQDFAYEQTPRGTIRETATVGEIRFLNGERGLTPYVEPAQAGAKASIAPLRVSESPLRLGYDPVVTPSFFSELELAYIVSRSPATRPVIIQAVKTKKSPAGSLASEAGTSYVDVPQSDGTVIQQAVKVEQPAQTPTVARTETINSEPISTTSQKGRVTESIYANTDAYAVQSTPAYPDFYVGGENAPPIQRVSFGQIREASFVGTGFKFDSGLASSSKSGQASRSGLDFRTGVDARQAQDVGTAQAQFSGQTPFSDVTTGLDSLQSQATDTASALDTIQTPRFVRPRAPTGRGRGTATPETPKIPKIPRRFPSSEDAYFGSFGVQVRRKGKFQTIGEGLSLAEATKLGVQRVRTTTSASFKLFGRDNTPKYSDVRGELPYGEFRRSKREQGVIVERRGFRISTSGEKSELKTAKGAKGLFGSGIKWAF